jgi:TolA-binding protein
VAAPNAKAKRRRPVDTASTPAPATEAPDEAELLARAHAALKRGDTAHALTIVAEHERMFPRGVLTQEREAIAIEGLAALGRGDEARRRLHAFAARYPESGYLWRLERVVEP